MWALQETLLATTAVGSEPGGGSRTEEDVTARRHRFSRWLAGCLLLMSAAAAASLHGGQLDPASSGEGAPGPTLAPGPAGLQGFAGQELQAAELAEQESVFAKYTAMRESYDSTLRAQLGLTAQPPYWFIIASTLMKPVVVAKVFPANPAAGAKWTTFAKTFVFAGMSFVAFLHDVGTLRGVLTMPFGAEDTEWHKVRVRVSTVIAALALMPNLVCGANLIGRSVAFTEEGRVSCFGVFWCAYAFVMGAFYLFFLGGALALCVAATVVLHAATACFWTVAWAGTLGDATTWGAQAEADVGFVCIGVAILVLSGLALVMAEKMAVLAKEEGMEEATATRSFQFLYPFWMLVLQLATPVLVRHEMGYTLRDAVVSTYEDRHVWDYVHHLLSTAEAGASKAEKTSLLVLAWSLTINWVM